MAVHVEWERTEVFSHTFPDDRFTPLCDEDAELDDDDTELDLRQELYDALADMEGGDEAYDYTSERDIIELDRVAEDPR